MPVWEMACSALAHSSHLGFIGFFYISRSRKAKHEFNKEVQHLG